MQETWHGGAVILPALKDGASFFLKGGITPPVHHGVYPVMRSSICKAHGGVLLNARTCMVVCNDTVVAMAVIAIMVADMKRDGIPLHCSYQVADSELDRRH